MKVSRDRTKQLPAIQLCFSWASWGC